MSDSATSLRRRQAATTERGLIRLARHLAAERGLAGFTVEELCSEVGVSRRTFFNYFASKENAVIGIPLRRDDEDLEQAFTGSDGPLLDALLELHAARFARLQLTRQDVDDLTRAFTHDPRLLAQFLAWVEEGEHSDALLIAGREGWPDDDPRARAAVLLAGTFLRPAFEQYLTVPGSDFLTLLRERLTLTQSLLDL